ncbi:MAG TPA: MarR family transcriptional regulator [Streptosporangiaceae bacterium]|nr:MarR family transcriptional regulator [Streptosporangiaceae bacterium]
MTADPSTSEAHRQPGPGRLSFQDRTGYLLARAGWLSRHRWASMIGEFDINPSQYKALICLAELGPLCQRQLAELIAVDPRNCVPIVDSLAERGLVARDVDPADRRRRVLGLTGQGKRLAVELTAVQDRTEADILSPLDPAQQDLLRRMLVALLGRAQQDQAK